VFYTVEVYKKDGRAKNGERFVDAIDYEVVNEFGALAKAKKQYVGDKFRFEAHETYIQSKNLMSGEMFTERYDTPYYCSPRSETYWSS